jgi:hypothetical protein
VASSGVVSWSRQMEPFTVMGTILGDLVGGVVIVGDATPASRQCRPNLGRNDGGLETSG